MPELEHVLGGGIVASLAILIAAGVKGYSLWRKAKSEGAEADIGRAERQVALDHKNAEFLIGQYEEIIKEQTNWRRGVEIRLTKSLNLIEDLQKQHAACESILGQMKIEMAMLKAQKGGGA